MSEAEKLEISSMSESDNFRTMEVAYNSDYSMHGDWWTEEQGGSGPFTEIPLDIWKTFDGARNAYWAARESLSNAVSASRHG